ALGNRPDRLHAAVDRGRDALQRRTAVLDDLAQHGEREEAALSPLLLEYDLRERDRGEVLTAVVLDDLDVLARLHPATDFVERDVAALARVVQLAVAVPLDEPAHWGVGYHSFARAYNPECTSLTPAEHAAIPTPMADRYVAAAVQMSSGADRA